MKRIHRLILSRKALDLVALSALECHTRESRGFLLGYLDKKDFLCERVYHVGNLDRNPSEVGYSNQSAVQRLVKGIRLLEEADPEGYSFIGGFHIHPYTKGNNRRIVSQLSLGDVGHEGLIAEDICRFKQIEQGWMEVVVVEEHIPRERPSRLAYNEVVTEPFVQLVLGGEKEAFVLRLEANFLAPNEQFLRYLTPSGKVRKAHISVRKPVPVLTHYETSILLVD
ncbi:hypothetical protein HYZ97_00525 [Candidatus Pacearchaeota archaeon]|nr:hypothetical protein [Candidatus Pacearchaeota archaeon]